MGFEQREAPSWASRLHSERTLSYHTTPYSKMFSPPAFPIRSPFRSRMLPWFWVVVWGSALSVGTAFGAPDPHSQSICLSVSPLRAVQAIPGATDSMVPEVWRDQVLRSLRRARSDSGWFFRKAGECPENMATIDVFQKPDDVVSGATGHELRFRLEWRHSPGQTEFFLPVGGKKLPSSEQISAQLLAVADQMMARVELSSSPGGATVRLGSLYEAPPLGRCPMVLLVPPGALSLQFAYGDRRRRMDTLVAIGGFYEVNADFRPARIDPQTNFEPRKTWPMWSLTAFAVFGAVWAAREQYVAQRAYDRLGANNEALEFSGKWDDLRTANILRNGFFAVSLAFGTTGAWMEWSGGKN
ncbi:MAG: hypothetical protein RL173_3112 [Fibrobacterota bacterium]